MKTLFLLAITVGLSFGQNPEAELFVYYNNGPSDQWVVIVRDPAPQVFDKYLRPLPDNIGTAFGDAALY